MATREGVTVRVKVIVEVEPPVNYSNPSPIGYTRIDRELSRVIKRPESVYEVSSELLSDVSVDVRESLPPGLDEF